MVIFEERSLGLFYRKELKHGLKVVWKRLITKLY